MRRITPRTCLWPLTGVLLVTFALSIGLTYRSDHHCFAGTCGEWLFPLQARLHVVVWYIWISLSVSLLGLRAYQPVLRHLLSRPLAARYLILGKQLRLSGLLLLLWISVLYGILISIWWVRLRQYFTDRGSGLPGNQILAAVGMTGHLADVTTGMVLLPVSRHSALASFFKLSPSTTYTFHIVQAHVLFAIIITHGTLYATWAALYNENKESFRPVFPVLNPTYIYNQVWPGDASSLGIWRASLIFTGSVSATIMLAMFFTSFPAVRRKHFNLFYFTHLFGIVAIVVICLHASTMFYCTIPGLSMWLLDWSMRVYELREKIDSHLIGLGNGWYSLSLPLPRKRLSGCACYSPLAHFYIHHSESSIREIHPFTTITHLASAKATIKDMEASINVQFLFRRSMPPTAPQTQSQPSLRKSTEWTGKLAALADEEKEFNFHDLERSSAHQEELSAKRLEASTSGLGVTTSLRLEGPYFTPANPEGFRTVICLVAGTGLSGALAIAAMFHAQNGVRRQGPTIPQTPAAGSACVVPDRVGENWHRCVVSWTVRKRDYVDLPFFQTLKCEGLEFRIHQTGKGQARPDIGKELREACNGNGGNTWCYISGPSGFISAAEAVCRKIEGLKWFAARWD